MSLKIGWLAGTTAAVVVGLTTIRYWRKKSTAKPPLRDLESTLLDIASGVLVASNLVLGDKLGFFHTLKVNGPITADILAKECDCHSTRMVEEWLLHMTANDITLYDQSTDTYALTESAKVLLTEGRSRQLAAIRAHVAATELRHLLLGVYRSGLGLDWGEVPEDLSCITRDLISPALEFLLPDWIRSDPNLLAALRMSESVIVDIRCGTGLISQSLARAFPRSKVIGVDKNKVSLDRAQIRAFDKRAENTEFIHGDAAQALLAPSSADLVLFCDAFHNFEDPAGVVKQAHTILKTKGWVLVVEPLGPEQPTVTQKLAVTDVKNLAGISSHVSVPFALGKAGTGRALGCCHATSELRHFFETAGFLTGQTLGDSQIGPSDNKLRVLLFQKST